MNATQERAIARGIVEPNTCGQGYHAESESVPYVWQAIKLGWRYSHTTAVVLPSGVYELHHTYRRGDHAISFWRSKDAIAFGFWQWSTHWCGTARYVGGLCDVAPMMEYLRGVARRARKQGKPGFSV